MRSFTRWLVRDRRTGPVPMHLRDSHYRGAQQLGHGDRESAAGLWIHDGHQQGALALFGGRDQWWRRNATARKGLLAHRESSPR